jgi:hypothetical protein
MIRRLLVVAVASLALVASSLVAMALPAGASSPVSLLVDQGTAFGYLGHSCGGIQEQVFATGFDPTSGFPTGDAFLQTGCGGSGRDGGGTVTYYRAWVSATWDYEASLISSSRLVAAPPTNPTLTAFDTYGNEVYNSANHAYLLLSPTFVPTPAVTGISVTQGPSSGGTNVVISGIDLAVVTAVDFGGVPAASFTINSDRAITAVSPSTSAGTIDVTVTSAAGTSPVVSADQFTFVALPIVTGLSPNTGIVTGGTPVTITGSYFTGATLVLFGGIYAPFTVVNDSTIDAASPAAENVDTEPVTVTTVGGTSASTSASQFDYTPAGAAPTITNVSPNYGPPAGGTAVTITGSNFTGATAVDFGATPVAFTVVSDTVLTTVAPPGSGAVDITVTNATGTSAIWAADQFYYGPVIGKILPTSGSAGGGTKVSIAGHNLHGATAVDFGGTPALSFAVNSTGTAMTAYSPPEVGSGVQPVDITVTTSQGTSPTTPADVFTYAAPAVTKISPTAGSAGGNTTVIITGVRMRGTTSVTFGGIPAASFVVNAAGTAISAVTPPEAGTGVMSVPVTVTTAAGSGTGAMGFTYALPKVTLVSPASGPPAGGTAVTILGAYVYGATSVTFGTASATINTETATSITVVSPPGTGVVPVRVTTYAGTSAVVTASHFTY